MAASALAIKHTVTPKGDQNIVYFQNSCSTFSRIRVMVHTQGRQPSGMSDNHVSVFLLFAENGGAVRLNMITDEDDDPTGVLIWSQELYQLSNSRITHFDYQLQYSMEVGVLYNHIRQWGLQRYVFSGGGSGCRFWVYNLLLKSKEIGYLADGWPQDAWSKLSWQYSREAGVAPRQIQIRQGRWLNQKEWEDEWE